MIGALIQGFNAHRLDFEATSRLAIVGDKFAPNLVQHLREKNLEATPAPTDYETQIRAGKLTLVLEITEDYGERLRQGLPAPLTLFYNEADQDSSKFKQQVRHVLESYSKQLTMLRMQARGFDTRLLNAIDLNEENLSNENLINELMIHSLPFLLISSMLLGGFYLAVDSTAGEKERNSLEPLLSLPIARVKLVLGKFFSVWFFIFVSSVLACTIFYLLFNCFADEELLSFFTLNGSSITKVFLIFSPLGLLVASFLLLIAAYTKSTKEAQAYLGIAILIPLMPFLIFQFVKVKTSALVMILPFLSQLKLTEWVMQEEIIQTSWLIASLLGTFTISSLFLLATIWLYRQDRILS
jgi:sodium transport system permease protein